VGWGVGWVKPVQYRYCTPYHWGVSTIITRCHLTCYDISLCHGVTLPDYQGIGIGMAVAEAVAEWHRRAGQRMNVTGSHPALVAHCRRSPRWRAVNVKKTGSRGPGRFVAGYRGSAGRAVVSFEYVGERD